MREVLGEHRKFEEYIRSLASNTKDYHQRNPFSYIDNQQSFISEDQSDDSDNHLDNHADHERTVC